MILVLSSPKPGIGVSTTAALLALTASRDEHTILVDCHDDQSALFNTPAIAGTIHVQDRLDLVNVGDMTVDDQSAAVAVAATKACHVVIDAGRNDHPIHHRVPDTTSRLWVVRPCYLTLRRASQTSERPDAVIVLNELGRSLTERDIEAVLGAPVIATIDIHPDIARTVDAGLLAGRPPRHAIRSLDTILTTDEVSG